MKDLSLLGRSLSSVVIVDNCARSFLAAEEEWNRMSTLLGRREGLRAGEPDALSAVSGKEIGAFEGSG